MTRMRIGLNFNHYNCASAAAQRCFLKRITIGNKKISSLTARHEDKSEYAGLVKQ